MLLYICECAANPVQNSVISPYSTGVKVYVWSWSGLGLMINCSLSWLSPILHKVFRKIVGNSMQRYITLPAPTVLKLSSVGLIPTVYVNWLTPDDKILYNPNAHGSISEEFPITYPPAVWRLILVNKSGVGYKFTVVPPVFCIFTMAYIRSNRKFSGNSRG